MTTPQDKGQVAAENMLAANPDIDLVLGLNDSMALGAYNVIKGKDAVQERLRRRVGRRSEGRRWR